MLNLSNLITGIVDMPACFHPVETACWDITLGTAGTGFGQYLLGKTSSSPDMIPEAVDHVGIIVYGYLYEYGDLGILKTPAPLQSNPDSKYPVFHLRSREKVGDTEKSQEEFEAWVDFMNESDFQGSSYNVVTNSCIVWGMKACEFLEVPYPENWAKICDWAAENKRVTGRIGRIGVRARKVQIRVQTKAEHISSSDTHKKVVDYIRNKFSREDDSSSSSTD